MKDFNIAEKGHVVNALAPISVNGAAFASDYFHMKNHAHVDIIIQLGVTGATSTITVFESDDNAGTDENAIAFAVYKEETAAGDTLGARVEATTAGFATSTNDGVFYVISIDASQLSDGYPYLVVKGTDPGAATLVSIVAILGSGRNQEVSSPTVLS
jgi:hypothetical protein